MNLFRRLKLVFAPLRRIDPDFGNMQYQYISNAPERSYWECDWLFPSTRMKVGISLRGGEEGPLPEWRRFYRELPDRYDAIVSAARPRIAEVISEWKEIMEIEPPEDVLSLVDLAGFDVEDPREHPVEWEVSFETNTQKWLYIMVPFIGDEAQKARVDT